MQHFECDYMEGAAPEILRRLVETNYEKTPGYGNDAYCESARAKIRAACACPEAEVFFLEGGTQTNATVLDALLRAGEGVLAAETGHIAVHEAGAVETSGHKVLTVAAGLGGGSTDNRSGKLDVRDAAAWLSDFWGNGVCTHMVAPGAVYISHPTEYGGIYSAAELAGLHKLAAKYGMPLYVDGARLGYGLEAEGADVDLPALARNCDAFYIGGTKVGALFGEAVVFPRPGLAPRFFTTMKRHGAVMAKGRMLGIQFDTLFTDGLYLKIAKHAIEMSRTLRSALLSKGYELFFDSPTNQLFVIIDNKKLEEISKGSTYEVWQKFDASRTVVRFATSWATKEEDIQALIALL